MKTKSLIKINSIFLANFSGLFLFFIFHFSFFICGKSIETHEKLEKYNFFTVWSSRTKATIIFGRDFCKSVPSYVRKQMKQQCFKNLQKIVTMKSHSKISFSNWVKIRDTEVLLFFFLCLSHFWSDWWIFTRSKVKVLFENLIQLYIYPRWYTFSDLRWLEVDQVCFIREKCMQLIWMVMMTGLVKSIQQMIILGLVACIQVSPNEE